MCTYATLPATALLHAVGTWELHRDKASPSARPRFQDRDSRSLDSSHCLQAYTKESPLYRNANAALRLDEGIEEYAAFIWHTKLGIKQLVQANGVYGGIVWRSMTLNDEQLELYRPGRMFLWANFVSTSQKKERALRFKGNALFRINCAGKGVTYCADISHISEFPEEAEVLFFAYSGFIVTGKQVVDGRHVISLDTYDTLRVESELTKGDSQ